MTPEATALKISVVMPVYNGGPYFELALQSALGQTYGDIEIVIVNDGSTDGGATDALCRRYASQYPDRIQYILQDNAGVGGALNAGVRAMTGDIFCWLSHDDLYEPHKVASQVAFFQALGRPDAMLISDYALIDPEGAILHDIRLDHYLALASPRLPLLKAWVNGCTVFIPAALMKRKAGQDGPFEARYRHVQDYRLWMELLADHDFFHQPERLVRYRIHPGQDSRKPDAVTEGEELWLDMMGASSGAVRAQIAGSDWRFYEEAHGHLAEPYPAAGVMLAERRDAAVAASLVSVVVGDPEALDSVLAQTHPAIEVILVGGQADSDRIRSAPNRQSALMASRGTYVALVDLPIEPGRIARQCEAMQHAGTLISHLGPSPRTQGVMLHRLLIAEGLVLPEDPAEDDALWADAGRRRLWLALPDAPQSGPFDPAPYRLAVRRANEPAPWLGPSVDSMLQAFAAEDGATDLDRRDLEREPDFLRLKHPLPDQGDGIVRFTTGTTNWDYVVVIHLPPGDHRFLQMTVNLPQEGVCLIVVDENFAQVGARRDLGPSPLQWRVWFDLAQYPAAQAVVLQSIEGPREAALELHQARLFSAPA